VAQVVKMCERWGRWYEGFESEEAEVAVGDLAKPVRERLVSATAAIKDLKRAEGPSPPEASQRLTVGSGRDAPNGSKNA
jgi:hypothetical protein